MRKKKNKYMNKYKFKRLDVPVIRTFQVPISLTELLATKRLRGKWLRIWKELTA